MSYTVSKSSPILVPPAGPTPTGTLTLSSFDRLLKFHIDFISIFSHGDKQKERIKDAFSKALVCYYPVAGRIAWTEDDLSEPVVNCTGQGFWYVEARANCSLADVNYFEEPLMIAKEEILPCPPLGVKLEEQILLVQISEFSCGGLSVGISFNHMIFDGEGAAQFLKAVGEMASGLPELTVKPVWSREAIEYPYVIPPGEPHPSFTTFNFDLLVVDVSLDRINKNKELFCNQTGHKCSSFDIITAMVFISRAKAINLEFNDKVSLHFAASARHLLYDMFPSMKGYYGNFGYGVGMMKTSEEISNASLVEVTILIKHAKEAFSTTFNRAPNMSLDYGMVFISDWRRLGFNEVDYGWGKPEYVFTLNNQLCVSGVVTYLSPPTPKQGVRLMLRCVKEEHKAKFLHEIQKF